LTDKLSHLYPFYGAPSVTTSTLSVSRWLNKVYMDRFLWRSVAMIKYNITLRCWMQEITKLNNDCYI